MWLGGRREEEGLLIITSLSPSFFILYSSKPSDYAKANWQSATFWGLIRRRNRSEWWRMVEFSSRRCFDCFRKVVSKDSRMTKRWFFLDITLLKMSWYTSEIFSTENGQRLVLVDRVSRKASRFTVWSKGHRGASCSLGRSLLAAYAKRYKRQPSHHHFLSFPFRANHLNSISSPLGEYTFFSSSFFSSIRFSLYPNPSRNACSINWHYSHLYFTLSLLRFSYPTLRLQRDVSARQEWVLSLIVSDY